MKEWPLPPDAMDRRSHPGLLLVGLGSGAAAAHGGLPPLQQVTRQLADLLDRPVLPLASEADPDAAQATLATRAQDCGGTWLAALDLDVGLPLADGRCWAEALGAWRQPVLLVVPAGQLGSGLPAAATALLRLWRVPVVGLLQWGGVWQAEERRRDGLPWLGHLAEQEREPSRLDADSEAPGTVGLAAALAQRWAGLDLD